MWRPTVTASQTVKVTGHSPSICGTVVGPDMAPTAIDGSFVF